MLGKTGGACTRLKSKLPNLLLWHCLNHRLELAVGNSVKAVDGFNHIQVLLDKIYCCYSYYAKHQREFQQSATELEIEVRKIGKVFDVRWVASSCRAVNALVHTFTSLYQHFKQLSQSKFVRTHDRAIHKGLI